MHLHSAIAALGSSDTFKSKHVRQVLYRKMTDERRRSIAAVVKAADDYIATAHALLLRAELAKNGLKPVGGMEPMTEIDVDFEGTEALHDGLSARMGSFPAMTIDGFDARPVGE
jgi:hypothetical protein